MMLLFDLLSDIIKVDDVLLIVKSSSAVSEVRSNSLGIRQKEKWITIGENDGPAHMHVNSESIKSAKFVEEEKPEKTSFSVRFFDENNERVLAAFFTKMYGESKSMNLDRKKIYDTIREKYSSEIKF